MKNKNTISINESQLRDIIAETVKKVLKEGDDVHSEFENGYRRDIYGKGQATDTYPFDENEIKKQILNLRDAIRNIGSAMQAVRDMNNTDMNTSMKRDEDLRRVYELLRDCLWGEVPQKLKEAERLLSKLSQKFVPNEHNGFKPYTEQFK